MFGGHMTVFPTFSFLPGYTNAPRVASARPWRDRIWAWAVVDRDSPAEVKGSRVRLGVLRTFRAGGTFEQDARRELARNPESAAWHMAPTETQFGMGNGHDRSGPSEVSRQINNVYGEKPRAAFIGMGRDISTEVHHERRESLRPVRVGAESFGRVTPELPTGK